QSSSLRWENRRQAIKKECFSFLFSVDTYHPTRTRNEHAGLLVGRVSHTSSRVRANRKGRTVAASFSMIFTCARSSIGPVSALRDCSVARRFSFISCSGITPRLFGLQGNKILTFSELKLH